MDTGFGGDCGEDDPDEGLHEASGLSPCSPVRRSSGDTGDGRKFSCGSSYDANYEQKSSCGSGGEDRKSRRSTMMSETAEQPPEWFETDPLRVALKVTVLAQVMKNDPKFGMRILGQEVGTKVLFKFLGGVVAVYAFLAPKLFERGDSE